MLQGLVTMMRQICLCSSTFVFDVDPVFRSGNAVVKRGKGQKQRLLGVLSFCQRCWPISFQIQKNRKYNYQLLKGVGFFIFDLDMVYADQKGGQTKFKVEHIINVQWFYHKSTKIGFFFFNKECFSKVNFCRYIGKKGMAFPLNSYSWVQTIK